MYQKLLGTGCQEKRLERALVLDSREHQLVMPRTTFFCFVPEIFQLFIFECYMSTEDVSFVLLVLFRVELVKFSVVELEESCWMAHAHEGLRRSPSWVEVGSLICVCLNTKLW